MNKIKLADGTEYEILEGTSLNNIKMRVEKFDEIEVISKEFSTDNLKTVEFLVNDKVTGKYTNLVLENISFVTKTEEKTNMSDDSTNNTSSSDSNTNESESSTSKNAEVESNEIYEITISLRESTDIELRILKLESTQEILTKGHKINADAIDGIIMEMIDSDENITE